MKQFFIFLTIFYFIGIGFLSNRAQAKTQNQFPLLSKGSIQPANQLDNLSSGYGNKKYFTSDQSISSSSPYLITETTSDSQNFSKVYGQFENDVNNFQSAKNSYEQKGHFDKSFENNYLQQSQKILSDIINVLIFRNQDLSAEIKENSDYYGVAGENILKMIDKDDKALGKLISKTNSVLDAKSLGAVAGNIKNIRFNQQSYLKKLIFSAHLGYYQNTVIKTAQKREKIIGQEIERVKEKGKDTTSLENMLNQADYFVNLAASSTDSASALIGAQNIDAETLSQFQDFLDNAAQSVQSAYKLFKQIAIDGNVLYSKKSSTKKSESLLNTTSTNIYSTTTASSSN